MLGSSNSAGLHGDSAAIRLSGGHAEKTRTIAAYRDGERVDVEIRSKDGAALKAHGLVLVAGSEYFDALYKDSWPAAPHVLSEWFLSTETLKARQPPAKGCEADPSP